MFGSPTISELGPLATGFYSPVTAPAQEVRQGGVITRDSSPKASGAQMADSPLAGGGVHPTAIWWVGVVLALVLIRVIHEVAE